MKYYSVQLDKQDQMVWVTGPYPSYYEVNDLAKEAGRLFTVKGPYTENEPEPAELLRVLELQ